MSSPASTAFSLGKSLILLNGLSQSVLAFVFDYNETHVKNPRWPPHARFHNGQTMSLGVLLATFSAYLAFRPASLQQKQFDVFHAAIIGSMYFVAGISAILYPGTKWMDPEFGEGSPQAGLFVGMIVVAWVGWWLESRRLIGLVGTKRE